MNEVKRLKEQVIKLEGKEKVRPSQDNRDSVVKKLEKGSNITRLTLQQDQKSIKHKISRKKSLGHIKCYRCLEKRHYAKNCQIKPNEEERLSRSQRKLPENRMCFGCRKKGHMTHCCPQQFRSDQTGQTGNSRPVKLVQARAAAGPVKKPTKPTLPLKKTCDAHKYNNKVKSTFVKLKHRICYTCRAKGHMSKDCRNGNLLNTKLVQYDIVKLGKDKMNTHATKVIKSPNVSIRAIWVPKSIVANVAGPNNIWAPKKA